MVVGNTGEEASMKERVDEAHEPDDGCAKEETHAAFAPGFIQEHHGSSLEIEWLDTLRGQDDEHPTDNQHEGQCNPWQRGDQQMLSWIEEGHLLAGEDVED